MYTRMCDCVQTVHEMPLLPNNIASETFYTNLGRCEGLTRYIYWGAGLAVIGQIRKNAQEV